MLRRPLLIYSRGSKEPWIHLGNDFSLAWAMQSERCHRLRNSMAAEGKYSRIKGWYHQWNHCRPWLRWTRVYMGIFLWYTLRTHWEVDLEVCTPALQDLMHCLFFTKVFPFSIYNLNLDKSDEENEVSIFKTWADSKTSTMASLWYIWTLKSYFLSHWMGILTLKTLVWYSIPSLLFFAK